MLVDNYNPFDNLALSATIAAIPVLLFLLCLTVLKMKGVYAALLNLGVTILIVLSVFKLPIGQSIGGVVQGTILGLWQNWFHLNQLQLR